MDDLCRELSDEFETIGESEKVKYLVERYELKKRRKLSDYTIGKIYPSEHCPCGSGKKYKKCCRRK